MLLREESGLTRKRLESRNWIEILRTEGYLRGLVG